MRSKELIIMDFELSLYDERIVEELRFRKINVSHDYVEYLFAPNQTFRIKKQNKFLHKPVDEQLLIIFIDFFENGIIRVELIIRPMVYHQEIEIFKDLDFIDEFLSCFLKKEVFAIIEELAFKGMIQGTANFDPSELRSSNQYSTFKPSILKYISDENIYQFRIPSFWYSLARSYIYKTKPGHPKGILNQIKDPSFLRQVNWNKLVEHTTEYKSINKKHRKKLDELVKEAKYESAGAERDTFNARVRKIAMRDWPEFEQ